MKGEAQQIFVFITNTMNETTRSKSPMPKSILKPRKLSEARDSFVYHQTIRARSQSKQPSETIGWPMSIDRLKGKCEESNGYRLEIINDNEAVLKEKGNSGDEKMIMRIHVENGKQKVGIPNRIRDQICYKWYHSRDAISNEHHYNIALRLLDEIKWKVAKVIFHNSSICRGGTIRLMENGDMRMRDELGILYNVKVNSNEVLEGNPKYPSGPVNDPVKQQEILKYRDLCKESEEMIERLGFTFPFVSSEITNGSQNQCRIHTEHRVFRARSRNSTCDPTMLNRSAPSRIFDNDCKEGSKSHLIVMKSRSGDILGVKDKSNGTSLRISSANINQYVYTNSNGVEERFTFNEHSDNLSETQLCLMRKLNDLKR